MRTISKMHANSHGMRFVYSHGRENIPAWPSTVQAREADVVLKCSREHLSPSFLFFTPKQSAVNSLQTANLALESQFILNN
jgi:hypothetical protein